MAEKNDDRAIFVTCLTYEAINQIYSESTESIINAQEAIAKARSCQMHPACQNIPQVWAMLNCVDLICSLIEFNFKEAAEKMKLVQNQMDEVVEKQQWSADGSMAIPLGKRSAQRVSDFSAQIYTQDSVGLVSLNFTWMNSVDAYAMAYLLSGITAMLKSPIDPKAETYIREGNKTVEEFLNAAHSPGPDPMFISSKSDMLRQLDTTSTLHWFLGLYQTIIYSIQTKWTEAHQLLFELETQLNNANYSSDNHHRRWVMLLKGMVEQGSGNTDKSIQSFRWVMQNEPTKPTTANKRSALTSDDISVLARLNLLLALRDKSPIPTTETEQMVQDLSTMDLTHHPNQAIRCAMAILSATSDPKEAITIKKQSLQQALTISRCINNVQLISITMAAMVSMFFKDITVGEQASKSRETAWFLAKRAAAPLWIGVAGGLRLQGEHDEEARKGIATAVEGAMEMLDEGVKRRFKNEG